MILRLQSTSKMMSEVDLQPVHPCTCACSMKSLCWDSDKSLTVAVSVLIESLVKPGRQDRICICLVNSTSRFIYMLVVPYWFSVVTENYGRFSAENEKNRKSDLCLRPKPKMYRKSIFGAENVNEFRSVSSQYPPRKKSPQSISPGSISPLDIIPLGHNPLTLMYFRWS